MSEPVDPNAIQQALERVGAQWQAQPTAVSDLSIEEKRRRLGYTPGPHDIPLQHREQLAAAATADAETVAAAPGVPGAYDLRNVNGQSFVTAVKDQGACGSCVAFGTCATVEGTLKVLNGDPRLSVDLSEAQLFYCGARNQGYNCDTGWYPDAALDYFVSNGVADERCYPYTSKDQNCTKLCSDWQRRATYVTGWHQVTSRQGMKAWISSRGPLDTCFTVYEDFYSYAGGVYHHVAGDSVGGHCVSVVGYNDAQRYWICKNSWGTGWGEHGFFRIGYGQCGIDAAMWAVEGATQSKVTLSDAAIGAPALAALNDQTLVLAWTGTDQGHHLNVMTSADGWSFADKVTLDAQSLDGPACAAGGGHVFVAWVSQDSAHSLAVISSGDGRSFGKKVTLAETSPFGPALAYGNGRVVMAWAAPETRQLSIVSSPDGVTWGTKTTLNDTTVGRPSLAFVNGTLYLMWAGSDSSHRLNVISSADGENWAGKVTLSESSGTGPAVALATRLHLVWSGTDAGHHLNELSGPSLSSLGAKRTYGETSNGSPALVTFGGRAYLAWAGTDGSHRLRVMCLG